MRAASPRTGSASAIAACGLLELARWAPDAAARCRTAAEAIVQALWTTCATRDLSQSDALVRHGTQRRTANIGVDEATCGATTSTWRPCCGSAARSGFPYW